MLLELERMAKYGRLLRLLGDFKEVPLDIDCLLNFLNSNDELKFKIYDTCPDEILMRSALIGGVLLCGNTCCLHS